MESLEEARITIHPYESTDGLSKETYGIDFSPVVEVLTADAVGNNEAAYSQLGQLYYAPKWRSRGYIHTYIRMR